LKAIYEDDPDRKVKLRVRRGDPDGYFDPNERVRIKAKKYDRREFVHWEVKDGNTNLIEDLEKRRTYVTMPKNARLEPNAVYEDKSRS